MGSCNTGHGRELGLHLAERCDRRATYLTVEATDKAGNKTTQTLDFTIDTRLSTPTITMDSRDDTGAIGDHITSVKRPGFTIGNIDSDAQSVILRITQGGNSQEVTLTRLEDSGALRQMLTGRTVAIH